jgi:diadenosine tetraphosphate (Ap4A) HIT family hydrolase
LDLESVKVVMDQDKCPFCSLDKSRICVENDVAVAFLDAFPITEGHTLVIPKRHVTSVFDLPDGEQMALWNLVALVRGKLVAELKPDGFTIGLNDGTAAGQTVMHSHVHVIPRRMGDVADPKGGIRWVIPENAAYWIEERR